MRNKTTKWRWKDGKLCILAGCRRKAIVGKICCKRHAGVKINLKYFRLPVVIVD